MIQIVFTDNGKVHTVTFSGEESETWAARFIRLLVKQSIDYEIKSVTVI